MRAASRASPSGRASGSRPASPPDRRARARDGRDIEENEPDDGRERPCQDTAKPHRRVVLLAPSRLAASVRIMPPQPNEEDAAFVARLAGVAGAVERVLETFLADAPRPGEIARPPRLMAAMRHAALAGGKRLRPFLVVGDRRASSARRAEIVQAGAAVEILHCYSLVHDDLPAMDDDDLRRGRPSVTSRLRRGDGDPRRRRAPGAGLRAPRRSGGASRPRGPQSSSCSGLRAPAGSAAWPAARCSTLRPRAATATPPRTRRRSGACRR